MLDAFQGSETGRFCVEIGLDFGYEPETSSRFLFAAAFLYFRLLPFPPRGPSTPSRGTRLLHDLERKRPCKTKLGEIVFHENNLKIVALTRQVYNLFQDLWNKFLGFKDV